MRIDLALDDVKITLKRGPCHGSCPVYELTVLGSGEVIYKGEAFVKEIGERRSSIPQKDVSKLLAYAMDMGFFELESGYYALITDVAEHEVTVKIGDREKKVIDQSAAPILLQRFESMIDRVCQSRKWVGTWEERKGL